MKHNIAIGLLMAGLLSSTLAEAQTSSLRPLTLSEYTSGSPEFVYPKTLHGLQWLGKEYIYLKEGDLIVGNKAGERVLMSLSELQTLLAGREGVDKLKRFPSAVVVGGAQPLLRLTIGGVDYFVAPHTKEVKHSFARPRGLVASQYNDQLSHIAIVHDHNITIHPLHSSKTTHQVTTDGSPTLVYGQSVHQNEFGIHGGLFWSPDGSKLAFYRMDQSMVKPYPILHIDARRPYAEDQYYPMAGTPSHHVTVGIYDLATSSTTYLKTGLPADKYLTNIAWTPDSKEIYIAEVNRAQNVCELKAYSPTTGEVLRTLLTERDECYTEPQAPAHFVPGSTNLFVWQSRRDGWNHLYLYDTQGKLIKQLTEGAWEVTDFQGFTPDGKTLFYQSTAHSPLDRQLYSLGLRNGQTRQLTPEAGWHTTRISAQGDQLIDIHESTEVARRITLTSASTGKVLKTLLHASNPDLEYATPTIELGTIKAADGSTDLHYRLLKPYDFDPTRRYPAIIYVYNGPHAQLVQNRHRAAARGWDLNMANQGYIILTIDGRGSAARGAAFEQVIHRQLGKHEMADQLQGVELLRSLGYVDMERIGVYGWSYGGFMATNLMLTYPQVFKVGVAGGPVMDWARYEIMYGERYMDTPEENPEGYASSNLLRRAGDLKGRLLLIHGTIDPVVIWQHSLLFVQEAVKAGTHPDYMVYPEHPHNVVGPDRVHLNQVITRYFQDHL